MPQRKKTAAKTAAKSATRRTTAKKKPVKKTMAKKTVARKSTPKRASNIVTLPSQARFPASFTLMAMSGKTTIASKRYRAA